MHICAGWISPPQPYPLQQPSLPFLFPSFSLRMSGILPPLRPLLPLHPIPTARPRCLLNPPKLPRDACCLPLQQHHQLLCACSATPSLLSPNLQHPNHNYYYLLTFLALMANNSPIHGKHILGARLTRH